MNKHSIITEVSVYFYALKQKAKMNIKMRILYWFLIHTIDKKTTH